MARVTWQSPTASKRSETPGALDRQNWGVSCIGAGSSAKGLWLLPSVVCGAWVTERPQLVLEVVGLGEVVAAEQVDVIVDER